jgi:hypothetical protein
MDPGIDFWNDDFPTVQQFPHIAQRSIMPLVMAKDDQFRPIGTCFVVANQGLALTAAHVLKEGVDLTQDSVDDWHVAAVYAAQPEEGDEIPNGYLLGGFLPVIRMFYQPAIDIAAIQLRLPVHNKTEKPIPLPSLRLSPGIPVPGFHCYSLGYNTMEIQTRHDLQTHRMLQRFSATRGYIQQVHFPARDSVICPFPCFRTNARIDGGMSGSPFMRGDGNVIGVACSSYHEQANEDHVSYVSLIGPALLLQITTGQNKLSFLYDFIVGGAIAADESLDTLSIQREGDMLDIDFGIPPAIRNILGQ